MGYRDSRRNIVRMIASGPRTRPGELRNTAAGRDADCCDSEEPKKERQSYADKTVGR